MPRRTLCAVALLTVPLALAAALNGAAAPREPSPSGVKVVASEFGSHFVPLGKGKSIVVDLPRDIKDVLVADPKIANAVIRTVRRAYIIGIDAGATNIVFFDAEGRPIANFEIAVARDVNVIRTAIRKLIPGAEVNVESIGDGIVLTGFVQTPMEAQQAYDIASHFVDAGDGFFSTVGGAAGTSGGSSQVSPGASNGGGIGGSSSKVVNAIVVRGRDQVMLKVTVAEVKRDVIKQLGIDLSGSLSRGTAVLNFATNNPFSTALQTISNTAITGQFSSVTGTLRAMERAGVIRTLAEPTLTAISGESATFLAGGELPYPKTFSCGFSTFSNTNIESCQTGIDYKKFGVSLTFTPVVLGEGRISLKVMTEVSDLSTDNSLTLAQGGTQQFGNTATTIPSFRVRRADTTVEIPSGGALALAGMIEEQTKQSINGFPALQQLPILGTLFRSRDYVNMQTELMILVTPYVVHAVAQSDLSRPDDGFADAPDPQTVLLGRLNRLYRAAGSTTPVDPSRLYRGTYGFILE